MRIVFFGPQRCLDPLNPGGGESIVRRLSVACAELGSDTEIVLHGGDQDGIREWPFGSGPRVIQFVRFADALRGIENLAPDVLIAGSLWSNALPQYFCFTRTLPKATKLAMLQTEMPRSLLRLRLRTIATCGRGGPVLCVSPRQYNICRGAHLSAHLLPPPIAPVFYEAYSSRAQRGLRRIAFVGRLDPHRGFDELPWLFQAISRLAQHRVPVEFAVHGYYTSSAILRSPTHAALLQLCGSRYVYAHRERLTYTPQSELRLRQVFQNVDLVLLPYRTLEGTLDVPLLPLEAAASGCLVLTTPMGGLRESLKGVALTTSLERIPSEAVSLLESSRPPQPPSSLYSHHAGQVAREFTRIFECHSPTPGFSDSLTTARS